MAETVRILGVKGLYAGYVERETSRGSAGKLRSVQLGAFNQV